LGDNGLIGETKNTLHVSFRCGFHFGADFIISGIALEGAGEINNGNVGGWHSESHTGKLAIKLWDDLTDGLGGTS